MYIREEKSRMHRKLFQFFWLTVVLSLVSFSVFANGEKEDLEIEKNENGSFVLETSDISIEWHVEDGELHMTVTAPTTGWVAVGFKPTQSMKDANFIIGYVSGSSVTVEDHFGYGIFGHKADTELGGTRDVTLKSGSEENGSTSLAFSLPLASGDQYDREIAVGEEIKVLLAYGGNGEDNLNTKHRFRTSAKLFVE